MRVCVLVSGHGSNLQALLDAGIEVVGVVADREAFALQRAERAGVPTLVVPFERPRAQWDRDLTEAVATFEPDLVVLAGFLRLVGPAFLARHRTVINLHPALPTEFPGLRAIERAWAERATRTHTGVMVHQVTLEVDAGPVFASRAVPMHPEMTLQELESAVHACEHELLVEIVRRWALSSRSYSRK